MGPHEEGGSGRCPHQRVLGTLPGRRGLVGRMCASMERMRDYDTAFALVHSGKPELACAWTQSLAPHFRHIVAQSVPLVSSEKQRCCAATCQPLWLTTCWILRARGKMCASLERVRDHDATLALFHRWKPQPARAWTQSVAPHFHHTNVHSGKPQPARA